MERYQQKCDVAQENHALILDKSDQWQGFRQQKLGSSQWKGEKKHHIEESKEECHDTAERRAGSESNHKQ